jgi:hypothetical protein
MFHFNNERKNIMTTFTDQLIAQIRHANDSTERAINYDLHTKLCDVLKAVDLAAFETIVYEGHAMTEAQWDIYQALKEKSPNMIKLESLLIEAKKHSCEDETFWEMWEWAEPALQHIIDHVDSMGDEHGDACLLAQSYFPDFSY